MIAWKLKKWRAAGAAAALGLTACGGEGGENGQQPHGEGGEAGESGVEAPAPAPETAVAPAGGEQGEAGAASAYAGLSGDQLTALRLQHLKGFVLAAQTVANEGHAEAAAILVQQGLLEVHAPAVDQFGALDVAAVEAAGADFGADTPARIRAAIEAIDRASSALEADRAVLAARMVDIATGLYQGVIQADYVDLIEYQHSHGAALAALDALRAGASDLRRRDGDAYRDAEAEMQRFVALWPAPEAPPQPTPYRGVLAQSSRVRLALSPYL